MLKKTLLTFVVTTLISLPALGEKFILSSNDIGEGEPLKNTQIFSGFGCKGENKSPQLSWNNAPQNTKSFVLTAYDPDAPTGSGWWHWVAFNISSKAYSVETDASGKNTMPTSTIQSRTDFGTTGFGGACPPKNEVHRYIFTIYALNKKLDLDASASPALVGFMAKANMIDSAKITAVYTRQ